MELSSLPSVFFFFFSSSLLPLLLFLFYYQNHAKKPTSNSLNTSYPLLGTLLQFVKNRHRFLDWTTEILTQNPTHTMTLRSPGQVSGIITANPLNVEHMLKTNFNNYPKGDRSISMLLDFLGHGIFNSDGDNWKQQRKAASFEFNKKSLRNFVVDTVHYEIVQRLLPLLTKAGEKNEIVDLQDVLERFAFDNICKVAFGEDPACLFKEEKSTTIVPSDFMKAFGEAQTLVMDRFMDPLSIAWRIKKLLNIGSEKQLKQSIAIVHNFATKIVKLKEERSADQIDSDLLSRFASNKDNTEELLRDIVVSFILAGRETTSSALTWFFWLLHAAISEAMRLYPPVAIDTQSCLEDDLMPDGTFVGKGWFVTYSAYAMGRMEDIWGKDCRDYKPERWLENGTFRPENPFRYPVFHAGPRMCLGKEMAYIQMKSIAASVLEKFEINVMLEEDKTPEHVLSLTFRMKGGLPIRVRERESVCMY